MQLHHTDMDGGSAGSKEGGGGAWEEDVPHVVALAAPRLPVREERRRPPPEGLVRKWIADGAVYALIHIITGAVEDTVVFGGDSRALAAVYGLEAGQVEAARIRRIRSKAQWPTVRVARD